MTAMMEDLEFDGPRVKLIRVRLGETQAQFAARLGVAENTVTSWETGFYRPTLAKSLHALLAAERQSLQESEPTRYRTRMT